MTTHRDKLHEIQRRRAKIEEKRAELRAEFRGIVQRESELPDGEALPDADVSRLAAIEAELESLGTQVDSHEAQIARLTSALSMEGDDAAPLANDDDAGKGVTVTGSAPYAMSKSFYPDQRGFKAARFMIGLLHAKSFGFESAARHVMKSFGDAEVAKALNTSGVSTGGALIPQNFIPDLIELLRARVVVRDLGPMIVPMPSGNATIPRLAAAATAAYQGELDDIGTSQQTIDDIQLNAKKLTALVAVSNDLIRRAPIGVEAIVRDDLVETLARREDIAFLRGDGSGNSPIGLLNQASASNKLLAAPFADQNPQTLTNAAVGVINGMMLQMEVNMARMLRPAWIMAPQTKWFISGLRDGVGNFIFKEEMDKGTLHNFPYRVSQQLPNNLLTGSAPGVPNGSELYLVDMADVVLGETYNVTVDASDVAAYKDGGGNMVSAYQRDQTLFRVISEHDLALRHQASVVVALLPAWVPAGYTGAGGGSSYFVQALTNDSSAAPSTWGAAAPTGSNNPANSAAAVPGGTLPGRP